MISYEQAFSEIFEHISPLGVQRVRLESSLGYVLAQEVTAGS